jgi:hypothetical protein
VDSAIPAIPRVISAHGCQCASIEDTPSWRSDRVKLAVTAAVRPKTTPAATASSPARTVCRVTALSPTAIVVITITMPNASTHPAAGTSGRPADGGAAARNTATPAATRRQPAQSRGRSGRRDQRAASGSANSKSAATIGATSVSGPYASATACSP